VAQITRVSLCTIAIGMLVTSLSSTFPGPWIAQYSSSLGVSSFLQIIGWTVSPPTISTLTNASNRVVSVQSLSDLLDTKHSSSCTGRCLPLHLLFLTIRKYIHFNKHCESWSLPLVICRLCMGACCTTTLFQLQRFNIVIENMERREIHLIGGGLTVRNSDYSDAGEPGNI
jgi:hypothetical protein